MRSFTYDPAVAAGFPSVVGGVVYAIGLTNGQSSEALVEAFHAEQAAVRDLIRATPLSEVPSLAAWRRAFRSFGVDPTTYRSAAKALLRRLTKQGSIPSITAPVDIGNLVSIRYALPVAVFDQRAMTGCTTVLFASGQEAFTDLGSGQRETLEAGEVIFIDEAGLVSARRWCWRQTAESASGPEVLVTVEGHHARAEDDVAAAMTDLRAMLDEHTRATAVASGTVASANFASSDSELQRDG